MTVGLYRPVAPVAATGFSHRLTAYKIVRHFFGLSYRKISGSNQVKIVFLESVTFQFHARMLSSEVAQSLKSYVFFGPWCRDRSQSPPCWIFRVKQIHPSTAYFSSMPACSAQRSHSHYKVIDIFRTLGSVSLSVTAMVDFSGYKANTCIHPRPRRGRHGKSACSMSQRPLY